MTAGEGRGKTRTRPVIHPGGVGVVPACRALAVAVPVACSVVPSGPRRVHTRAHDHDRVRSGGRRRPQAAVAQKVFRHVVRDGHRGRRGRRPAGARRRRRAATVRTAAVAAARAGHRGHHRHRRRGRSPGRGRSLGPSAPDCGRRPAHRRVRRAHVRRRSDRFP